MSQSKQTEMTDLRTPSIYKEHAFLSAYAPHDGHRKKPRKTTSPRVKSTQSLDVGAQAKLQEAAWLSFQDGKPINTLLTIRACGFPNHQRELGTELHNFDRVRKLVESLRKWLTRSPRRHPVNYMWTREVSQVDGEHLHLGFFLNPDLREEFIEFLERILPDPKGKAQVSTRGEIARSANGNWHVAVERPDEKPQPPGYWIASYLGKGEPSRRQFRGRSEDNSRKTERGMIFGGRIHGDKYDKNQGTILGNEFRQGRFGISRSLSKLLKRE